MRNSSCTKISYPIKIVDLYSGSKAIPDKLIKKKFNKFLQKVNFNNAEELYICIAMNIESSLCKNFKIILSVIIKLVTCRFHIIYVNRDIALLK